MFRIHWYRAAQYFAAALIALAASAQAQALEGAQVETQTGQGCLDVNLQERSGGRSGYNVIVWPDCHGRNNQHWYYENNMVFVYLNNRRYCLDINRRHRVGRRGRNVIVWSDCHGRANQRWQARRNGTLRSGIRRRRLCLDVDRNARTGSGGRGRNVIAWPCHRGTNQRWRLR